MRSDSIERFEVDISNFTEGEYLGGGTYGDVYEANEKTKKKRKFAAKVFKYSRNDDDFTEDDEQNDETRFQLMIKRELEILMFVNHPTIVNFYGYSNKDFHNKNNITLLIEYADNGSLLSILKKLRSKKKVDNYTNTTRQIILSGVARGMKYIHDCNILHRDLKPDNILLDKDLHPKITDFGLSKFIEYNQSNNPSIYGGTYFYMAPEIFIEESYDLKVDVYAFGIVMYEVVTNLNPYPEFAKKFQLFKFINFVTEKKNRPKFDESMNVKKSIQNLIERCWSDDPNKRPTFSEIFNELTQIDGRKENCILDDVDVDAFQDYVRMITEIKSPIDILHDKIEKIESKHKKLTDNQITIKKNNHQLTTEKKKQDEVIRKLEDKNRQMANEIERLKNECNQFKKQLDENKTSYKPNSPIEPKPTSLPALNKVRNSNVTLLDHVTFYNSPFEFKCNFVLEKVPVNIQIGKFNAMTKEYYYPLIFKEGTPFPAKHDEHLYNNEIKATENKVFIPICTYKNNERTKIDSILIDFPTNNLSVKRSSSILTLRFRYDESGFRCQYKRYYDPDFSEYQNIKINSSLSEPEIELEKNENKPRSGESKFKQEPSSGTGSRPNLIQCITQVGIEIDYHDFGKLATMHIINQGTLLPTESKEILIYDNDLVISQDKKTCKLPLYITQNNKRISKHDISLGQTPSKYNFRFYWDQEYGLRYSFKKITSLDFSEYFSIDIDSYIQNNKAQAPPYENGNHGVDDNQDPEPKTTAKIELYSYRTRAYYNIYDKGVPLKKRVDLRLKNSDLKLFPSAKYLSFSLYYTSNKIRIKLKDINFPFKYAEFSGKNKRTDLDVRFYWDQNGLQYGFKKSTDDTFNNMEWVDIPK